MSLIPNNCYACVIEGVATPVMIYDPSNNMGNFIELPGQSLMWQGKNCIVVLCNYY